MTTATAKKKRTTQRSTADVTRDLVVAAIDADTGYQDAVRELMRLRSEQATRQSELDQLRAQSSDVESLVTKIESGEDLNASDSAEKISILSDQIRAYELAITRAEAARKKELARIQKEGMDDLASLHFDRLKELSDTMNSLASQIQRLAEIPRVMQGHELGPDNRFPMFHHAELQTLVPRIKHWNVAMGEFIGKAE